jgi:hypothetical protein
VEAVALETEAVAQRYRAGDELIFPMSTHIAVACGSGWHNPLVEVAWADGKLDRSERDAILAAAVAEGIAKGSPAYEILDDR